MIGSIGFSLQSAVTLYIYRVGKTYPARNLVYRYKSIKNSNCTRTPPRPVGPTGQTSWSCQTVYRRLDRSDRLDTPVRPVCSAYCQFWSSTQSSSQTDVTEHFLVKFSIEQYNATSITSFSEKTKPSGPVPYDIFQANQQ